MKSLSVLFAAALVLTACSGKASSPSIPVAATRYPATATPTLTPAATAPSLLRASNLAPVRLYLDALNQGDIAAALATFTDDAIWERGGQCPPGACAGTTAVRAEITRDVAAHHKLTPLSADESTGSVAVRLELRNDGTQRANVDRVVQIFAFKLRGGKISAVAVSFDGSDPVTAAFVASQAGTRR